MKKLQEHYLERSKYGLCEESILDALSSNFSISKLLNLILSFPIVIARGVVRAAIAIISSLKRKQSKSKNSYAATDEEMIVYAIKMKVPRNNIPFEYLNVDYPKVEVNEEEVLASQYVRDKLLLGDFTLKYTKAELGDGTIRVCFEDRELNIHLATLYREFKLGYFSEELSYLVTTKSFLNDLPVALEKLFLNRVELREITYLA